MQLVLYLCTALPAEHCCACVMYPTMPTSTVVSTTTFSENTAVLCIFKKRFIFVAASLSLDALDA